MGEWLQSEKWLHAMRDNPYHWQVAILFVFVAIDSIVVVDSTVAFNALIDSFCCCCCQLIQANIEGCQCLGEVGEPSSLCQGVATSGKVSLLL